MDLRNRWNRLALAARRAGPTWRVVWALAVLGATALGIAAPDDYDIP
jgi:hypothetical protein